jgi:nucleoside 2-deoxyribosyltransferase
VITARSFAVYVAGSAGVESIARVTAAIKLLQANGFAVTCTWPEVVAQVGNANPRDASTVERRGWSTQDLREIDDADAVWFLVPEPPLTTRGAWFEAGYAYASDKHLVFSGDTKQSVFCALGHECPGDITAFFQLCELRDRDAARTVEAAQ